MGLFSLFKKTEQGEADVESERSVSGDNGDVSSRGASVRDAETYRALADVLVDDATARAKLDAWIDDPNLYCQEAGNERGVDDCAGREDEVMWLALVDTLIDGSQQAVEIDWCGETEDLVWSLNSITKEPALHLDEDGLSEEDLTACFDEVNVLWNPQGWMLAYMDIDSDSYVLVPLRVDQFEAAEPLAARLDKTLTQAHQGL